MFLFYFFFRFFSFLVTIRCRFACLLGFCLILCWTTGSLALVHLKRVRWTWTHYKLAVFKCWWYRRRVRGIQYIPVDQA